MNGDEKPNIIVVVAHHWDEILQVKHMSALHRLVHTRGRKDVPEDERVKAETYVRLIEALMKIDGVKSAIDEYPPGKHAI